MATFSTSVISGTSFTCWKVRAMPRLHMSRATTFGTGTPSKPTLPEVGRNAPLMRLKSVVFPAPFGPSRPSISPARTSKLTSSTATRPPKVRRILVAVSSGRPASGLARTLSIMTGSTAGGRGVARSVHASIIGQSPRLAFARIRIMSPAKMSISRRVVGPKIGRNRFCNSCLTEVTRPAPSIAPQTCPLPPITVMNRYSMLM